MQHTERTGRPSKRYHRVDTYCCGVLLSSIPGVGCPNKVISWLCLSSFSKMDAHHVKVGHGFNSLYSLPVRPNISTIYLKMLKAAKYIK